MKVQEEISKKHTQTESDHQTTTTGENMYNGIGLTTPRGSGTNGHVSRNLSFVSQNRNKNHQQVQSNDEQTMKKNLFKHANDQILEHEKKRKIEAQLYTLQLELEDSGKHTEDEIEEIVQRERVRLTKESNRFLPPANTTRSSTNTTTSTHENVKAQELKNDKFKNALRIKPEIEADPSLAFNRDQREKKRKEELKQKYEEEQRHMKKKRRRDYSSSSDSSSSSSDSSSDSSASDRESLRKRLLAHRRKKYRKSSASPSPPRGGDLRMKSERSEEP